MVLLHGFGATHRAWDQVIAHLEPQRYRSLALDLPGHGESAAHAGPTTLEACADSVLVASPRRFVLCGYSMGGRVALRVALAAPERVTRVILVSSSPGIEDPAERNRRRRADRRLADELERIPFEDFIAKWREQPLFAKEPADVRALACADMRRNDPHSLAGALRGMGTGEMDSLWGCLHELRMPVTIVVGARDAKFLALGARMADLPREARLVVVAGGHGLPLESPRKTAEAIDRF